MDLHPLNLIDFLTIMWGGGNPVTNKIKRKNTYVLFVRFIYDALKKDTMQKNIEINFLQDVNII